MTDHRIAPPPAALLGSGTASPEARTVIAEVRSDSAVPFDPVDPPEILDHSGLIEWQVDVSWSQAQEIQLWLIGPPAGNWGHFRTREAALKDFFESLQIPDQTPPVKFLQYVGTYLSTDLTHARYAMILGVTVRMKLDDYLTAFDKALEDLLANTASAGWAADLVSFLKMMLNQPSSRQDFLVLASSDNVGDLTKHPGSLLIKKLISP